MLFSVGSFHSIDATILKIQSDIPPSKLRMLVTQAEIPAKYVFLVLSQSLISELSLWTPAAGFRSLKRF